MDIRELEYYTVIAQEGNLTRAAERLYVSQPTLSKYLQRLEAENGLTFFQHTGKTLTLTHAGRRYLDYAQRMLLLAGEMKNEMAGLRREDTGCLRVGMPPFRCSFSLPQVLPQFHRRYPGVAFEIKEDSSARLDEALLRGEIDLAFYNLSQERQGLCYELLHQDEIYAVVCRDHPVGQRARQENPDQPDAIRLEWLADEVLILQNGSQRLGQFLQHELKEKRIEPRRIMHSSNIRAAALLAANGYGAAFLSGDLLRHFESMCPFDSYRLMGSTLPINFAAAWREGGYMPGYARAFIEMMKASI